MKQSHVYHIPPLEIEPILEIHEIGSGWVFASLHGSWGDRSIDMSNVACECPVKGLIRVATAVRQQRSPVDICFHQEPHCDWLTMHHLSADSWEVELGESNSLKWSREASRVRLVATDVWSGYIFWMSVIHAFAPYCQGAQRETFVKCLGEFPDREFRSLLAAKAHEESLRG